MQTSSTDEISVTYISGYGRSGSTLLDTILGNHPEIVSAGALSNFFQWTSQDELCACGLKVTQCPFWKPVYEKFLNKHADVNRSWSIQQAVENKHSFKKLTSHKLDNHITHEYSELMRDIFELIANQSGKRYIVDSSKSASEVAGRSYALAKYVKIKVKTIHLVRDGRGVIWSIMNGPGSPERSQGSRFIPLRIARAIYGWISANSIALATARQLENENTLIVRYEELVTSPASEIRRIGDFLNIDVSHLAEMVLENKPFVPGHNLGGNRLRFSKAISIKSDEGWKRNLPSFYKISFYLLAWPLARKFQYKFLVPRR